MATKPVLCVIVLGRTHASRPSFGGKMSAVELYEGDQEEEKTP
jgi:hypothetical protein